MSPTTLALWQTVISVLAILASGGIAVLVPYLDRRSQRRQKNRARFDVTTTRFGSAGLRLEMTYQPEFTHVGMFAHVTLLSPSGARLQEVSSSSKLGDYFIGPGQVRLVRLDNEDYFSGAMLVLPPADTVEPIGRARLVFEVRTDSKTRLLREELEVSPVDETQSFWEK